MRGTAVIQLIPHAAVQPEPRRYRQAYLRLLMALMLLKYVWQTPGLERWAAVRDAIRVLVKRR